MSLAPLLRDMLEEKGLNGDSSENRVGQYKEGKNGEGVMNGNREYFKAIHQDALNFS